MSHKGHPVVSLSRAAQRQELHPAHGRSSFGSAWCRERKPRHILGRPWGLGLCNGGTEGCGDMPGSDIIVSQ